MRNRQRGDTFFNCLVVMVLVMGTVLWAWMKFGAVDSLRHPKRVTLDRSGNREAALGYQRRMRERFFGTSAEVVRQASDFVARARAGKYAEDKAAFDQRLTAVVRALNDNVGELNANQVPVVFAEGHLKLAEAHGHAYEAVQLVELARFEEPELQKKHYREATDLAAKASREVRAGRQLLEPNFR